MALTAELIGQYRRDGYVCPVPVMPASEAAGLRRRLEAFEATQGGKLEAVQRSRAPGPISCAGARFSGSRTPARKASCPGTRTTLTGGYPAATW